MLPTGVTDWTSVLLRAEKILKPTKTKVKQVGFIENTQQVRSRPVKKHNGPELPGLFDLNEGFYRWTFWNPGMIDIKRLYIFISCVHALTHNTYKKNGMWIKLIQILL